MARRKSSIEIIMEKARESAKRQKEDYNKVVSAQDGSYAIDLPVRFVGGKLNGEIISHTVLMKMSNKGYTPRWSAMEFVNHMHDNILLEDQPIIDGYLSPCLDGDYLRYETQEVYDMLSH